jgi:hypothetical protein
MTCIVGLVTPKGIYLGGDSAGVGGYSLTVRADEKVLALPAFWGVVPKWMSGRL